MSVASPPPELDPDYVAANRDVVGRVVTLVGATGLLDGGGADPETCGREAGKVRDFLNMEIPNIRGGGMVDGSFKRMRRSARDFVRAAGPGGSTFHDDRWYFDACLGAMRLTLGDEVAALSAAFGLAAPGG